MKTPLTFLLLGIVGAAALWYAASFRAWVKYLHSPEVSAMDERQRAELMASPRYARMRNALRLPMYVTTVAGALLYLVMRLPS